MALLEPGAVVRDVAGLPRGDQVAVAPQALHFLHAEQILDHQEPVDLEPGDLFGGQPVQRHWRWTRLSRERGCPISQLIPPVR